MTIYYDNWCKNCTRFVRVVRKLDWLGRIDARQLRDQAHLQNAPGLDVALAQQQVATVYAGKWRYGYDSLYRVFLRLPLFWLLIPLFWLLKITRLGQYAYLQLAVNRRILPIHCDQEECKPV